MIIQIQPSRTNPARSAIKNIVHYVTGGDRGAAEEVNARFYQHEMEPDRHIGHFVSDDADIGERIAYWSGHNVGEDGVEDAIREMALIQDIYKGKGKESKNMYHLVVSFPPGEHPTTKTMGDIEKTIAEGLGFTNHQRVSAVHVDTSHVHMHILINKVGMDLKKHTPYRDYEKVRKLAEHLEEKHQLLRVDHRTKREKNQKTAFTRADDIRRLSGRPSLCDWIKSDVIADIYKVIDEDGDKSWDQLHHVLANSGLVVRKRANGLVFQDIETGIFVKASAVNRQFSLAKLEKNYGKYVAPGFDVKSVVAQRQYANGNFSGFTKGMYSEYLEDNKALEKIRYSAIKKTESDFRQDVQLAWQSYKNTMSEIKSVELSPKEFIQAKLSVQIQHYARLGEAQKRYNDAKKIIETDLKKPAFIDYIREAALKGDTEKLNYINDLYSEYYQKKRMNHGFKLGLSGVSKYETYHDILSVNSFIAKNGGIYANLSDGSMMFSNKTHVWVNARSDEALLSALSIAKARYGNTIKMEGDVAQIRRCHQLIQQAQLGIKIQGIDQTPKHNDRGIEL